MLWQYSDGDLRNGGVGGRCGMKQEAQLSQRDGAMLHFIEYFAKSLKITLCHSWASCYKLAAYSVFGQVVEDIQLTGKLIILFVCVSSEQSW